MILVTGGAGFIGSNVAAALSDRGVPVVVCDRLRNGSKWRNLAKTELRDLVAPEALPDWLAAHGSQVDAIVHMGAISSTTETDADLIVETNFRLSWFLFDWCARERKRFIYASSAATYGAAELGFAEAQTPSELASLRPLNAYGWSKHLFDRRVARAVAEREPLPVQWVGLKFFNVYGPNEYHKGAMQSVVAQRYAAAAAGQELMLYASHHPKYADGGQLRDFIYVEDCVAVLLWLLEHAGVCGLFNVGSGRARSFADLAQALFAAVGQPPRIRYVPMPEAIRPNYQYFTEARLDRLRQAGFQHEFISLEDGVRRFVERYLVRADRYR
jgi:ADP-L-glycero-D-manno-heptose 6-epimerase